MGKNYGLGSLLVICFLVLLMPLSVYATDMLVVKDAGGVNTKFVVTDTGTVGIGTATPQAALQIGTVTPPNIGTPWDFYSYNPSYGRFGIDSGNNNAGIEFLESTVRKWFMGSYNGTFGVYNTPGAAFDLVITSSGNVGIGTTTPTHLIQLSGGAYSDGATWVNASSREYKENIRDLTASEAIDALLKLDPVKYNYKADEKDKHVGFIAEDVPDLVATKDRKGLSPMDIVAVLTKVVQEQQKTIADLKGEMAELKKTAFSDQLSAVSNQRSVASGKIVE